jgi:ribonuclease HII
MTSLHAFDDDVRRRLGARIVGIDEAGRGPLAGPVVAAAVQLSQARPIEGIDDSKKLSARKREALYGRITGEAVAWAYASASPEEIDRYNILQASLLAMKRALDKLHCSWTLALIDGNRPIETLPPAQQQCVVGGDALSASIAAASIIAKVARDRMMIEYDTMYPEYKFKSHKGYATRLHRARIEEHGLCAIHRRSFCERIVAQTALRL